MTSGLGSSPATFTIESRKHGIHAVFVDPEDFEAVQAAGPWHISRKKLESIYYVRRQLRKPDGKRTTEALHRFILARHGLLEPGKEVDHANGIGTDNRKVNLRLASTRENQQNQKTRRDSSGCRGVGWHPAAKKWQARIVPFGRWIHLGLFDDKAKACHVARIARSVYYPFENPERNPCEHAAA
jgi:hypothetical protein